MAIRKPMEASADTYERFYPFTLINIVQSLKITKLFVNFFNFFMMFRTVALSTKSH